jgi:UDP-N-acetylmuramoyl-L-alanyl-D-glutamate--2,6-diaminopimelate ligase
MPADPLSHLLASLDFAWRREPPDGTALTDIQWRSDACGPGSVLFFQRFDDGLCDAEVFDRYLARSPCAALVTNRMLDCFECLPYKGIYVIRPGDWADVVVRFCDLVYPLKVEGRPFIGVTGTNGKTTTIKYLEAILGAHGRRVLTVGTLGLSLAGETLETTGFTSPPLIELRRLLHAYQDRCDCVVMAISSHALDQGRVHGLPLLCAGWTNFSQEHLDYHGTEDAYFAAKARILDLIVEGGRLYCSSSRVARRLLELGEALPVHIEVCEPPRLDAEAVAAKPFLALEHNRRNYALAGALADAVLGPAPREDWRYLSPVDGRFECRTFDCRTVVVDFAHTPDALETILLAIRAAFPGYRLMTLFGCGGERDRGKRPLMGTAAAHHSDYVIVTSDNPRHEDPERIIADILAGMPNEGREVVPDRAAAVARLFDLLEERPPGEPWVGLIAGKGHERYIDRAGRKIYYSDQDEVARNAQRLGWG